MTMVRIMSITITTIMREDGTTTCVPPICTSWRTP